MASTHDLLTQPDKAVAFYQKAYDQYEILEDYWRIGSSLVNLGGGIPQQ